MGASGLSNLKPITLLLAGLLLPLSSQAATVVSIGDGDTLRVLDGGKRPTIRLARPMNLPSRRPKPTP